MPKLSIDLYKEYLKERENAELIYTEFGFITYKFLPEHCYIEDIYIVPEKRKSGLGVELEALVIEIAKALGYKKVLGSVCTDANNWKTSQKVLEKIGYVPLSQEGNVIYFEKEIL